MLWLPQKRKANLPGSCAEFVEALKTWQVFREKHLMQMPLKAEQFITDAQGNLQAAVLNIQAYRRILEILEEL